MGLRLHGDISRDGGEVENAHLYSSQQTDIRGFTTPNHGNLRWENTQDVQLVPEK